MSKFLLHLKKMTVFCNKERGGTGGEGERGEE